MEKLHPNSIWLFFFSFLFRGLFFFIFFSFWVIPFLGAFIGVFQGESGSVGGSLLLLSTGWVMFFILYLIISFVWAKLTYRYWLYELAEDSFKKESGVIWKKYVSVPYERIQNIDINRGLFARILGLSDLQIQTAGSSAMYAKFLMGVSAEGRLPGLDKEVAEKLRDELIRRSRESEKSL